MEQPMGGADAHPALAVDYGEARIGVAASDPLGLLAHPVETIDRRRTDALERLAELAKQRGIRTVVVGLPLRMDGTEGDSARRVRSFAQQLEARLGGTAVTFQDETLSTATAAAKLHEAGRNARQQKAVIDQAAAVEILRNWMQTLPGADGSAPAEPMEDLPVAPKRQRRRR